ncbi:unnamed protein product [Rotaria sp. Silwood1]|nr:unnamed protein product [Rotaria sp. Silwood1]
MSVNERSSATSSAMSTQSGSGQSTTATTSGGPNHSDEQVEPASTLSIFSLDYKKHEDIKQMLDSNKDNLKLDAMRRIIGMIAKGKDAADLFPAVVKNVVSKNMEIKKLVYVYLMRYAEEQQDLALLSIATFQRGLKDPNQLIRASALRVLSSIRVPTIVTIMMLAIRDAANDMSAYVRKTAANAIAKLYALDPEMKDELILIITKLLADKTILVNGSAVQAFEHVCPERIDLIHKNYRRLCNLLVDIDEWGQVIVLNMLTRYARTQFVDPNKTYEDDKKDFYDDDTNVKEKTPNDDDDDDDSLDKRTYVMDTDHRLLLRCTKPLLQNRNSAKQRMNKKTWKEYLSYKKEYENEKRKVEKMTNEGRDEYDLRKAQEVLKETESMISHTKSSFIKSWKEFQDVYNAATNDETLKQSKEYEEAQKVHDDLDKAQQEDRAAQA